MKIVKPTLLILLIGAIAVALLAPIGPLPGFFIGGTPAATPAQWPDTSNTDEIKLRVPGTLPRVVIIWVVAHDGDLYVVGSKQSGWVSKLGQGGPVEMRLGDNTYSLTAAAVTQGWQDVLTAYVNKYRADYPDIVAGFPTPEEAQGQVSVFRLARN